MGLDIGWRTPDVRESIWREDSALGDVPASVLEAWEKDGEAAHLMGYAKPGEDPQVITWRSLTQDEAQYVMGFVIDGEAGGLLRAWLAAARIGMDLAGMSDTFTVNGTKHARFVREKGIRMLAEPFVSFLARRYRGLVSFYGRLIYEASFASEAEKKASSPPSTQTPSSAGAPTKAADTAQSNEAA